MDYSPEEEKMTPAQIAEAQRLAREWMEKHKPIVLAHANDFMDGMVAHVRGDYKVAFEIFMPLANRGDADSQYYLGLMYSTGQGVTQDYAKAEKWFRLSAKRGNGKALIKLGVMHENDFGGTTKNYKEVIKRYRKTAEQGDAKAQYSLGLNYRKGWVGTKDDKEAHKWWKLSAGKLPMCLQLSKAELFCLDPEIN